jgi:beta-glucosidase
VAVQFKVRNTGAVAGDEVAQMYVTHLNSKVSRPIEELKGFDRIHLAAGETKTVTLPLTTKALAYWDEQKNQFVTEPDQVEIRIGSSSADIRLRQALSVTN